MAVDQFIKVRGVATAFNDGRSSLDQFKLMVQTATEFDVGGFDIGRFGGCGLGWRRDRFRYESIPIREWQLEPASGSPAGAARRPLIGWSLVP